MTTTSQHATSANGTDLLTILADDACRTTVAQLHASPNAVRTLEELVTKSPSHSSNRTQISASQLHHVTLPKLAGVGLLEYDSAAKTVRYEGNESLEAYLDAIDSVDWW